MKVIQTILLLLFTATASTADEAQPPSRPVPGVDLVLTKGKPAKEFFAERAANAAGRAALAEAKAASQADQEKLEALIAAKESRTALDKQERAADISRYELLLKMEECGPCATNDVKAVKITSAGRTQYWYVSDGSYLVEAADESQRKQKIRRLKQYLLAVPAKQDRLQNVIDYMLVDNETGQPLDRVRTLERSPFYAFSSIGKPVLGSVLAYDFYVKGVLETTLQPAGFAVKTEVVPAPKTFSPPLTDYVSPSGKSYFTHHENVRGGLSMTYLNTDGYLRLWNAANYGTDMELVRPMMRTAHLDILVQLDEMLERDGPLGGGRLDQRPPKR